MKITFWGIRGSHPAITENSGYGNHTSCVEVTAGKQRLIFDAGTGIHPCGSGKGGKGKKTNVISFGSQ